jgi:2-polyprenyl-3-methyl-5-hydroxy-6-metoxy-1,4-benzoquinol methylase
MSKSRAKARELANKSIEQGDFQSWFETLYKAADGQESRIPWADMVANPKLVSFMASYPCSKGETALVVACGLGDDAEFLADLGYSVTAFDISETCIDWCRRRHPGSRVSYQCADLFDLPAAWLERFDLIFEANTLQVLPRSAQGQGLTHMARALAKNGRLLICARLRDESEARGHMPWPLCAADFDILKELGLETLSWEDFFDAEEAPVRRVRALYQR